MWRLKSWTYLFNLIVLGLGIVGPFSLPEAARTAMIVSSLANFALREKTQKKVEVK